MTISTKITVDGAFNTDIEKAFTAILKTIAQRINSQIVSEMITQLGDYPGKPRYPLRWKSERQRKYVMAMLRQQNNIPYQRTGRLRNSWQTQSTISSTAYELAVSSTFPESVYVVGAIGTENITQAMVPQQPFHADTGWQSATQTISTFFDRAIDVAESELEAKFGEVIRS